MALKYIKILVFLSVDFFKTALSPFFFKKIVERILKLNESGVLIRWVIP
jgi:hypothetical protein